MLTTLAGDTYTGAQSTSDVLDATLASIEAAAAEAEAHGGRLIVLNSSHPEEDFSERWKTEQIEYGLFKDFIRQFRLEMAALRTVEGLDEQARMLNEMFGRGLGTRALDAYMKKVRAVAQARELLRGLESNRDVAWRGHVILAVDGGGLRGAFPAALLAWIEEHTGKRIAD